MQIENNVNQIANSAELLKQILPIPSNQVLADRFDKNATEAGCRPDGKCSGECVGFISAN